MAEGFNGIINDLERQKTAIERALLALRGIEGIEAPAPAPVVANSAPAKRKGGMTPAGRRRLSAALKKRWAAKRAEDAPAATPDTSTTKGKKRSAAVRKRMKEAQRLRWARIKGESEPPSPATPEAPKPKRQISAEGIKKIIAATKKRWALKRAEDKAAAKGAKPKNAAA
jgi:hypothetical protein